MSLEERQEGPLLVFPFGQEGVPGTWCSRSADEGLGDGCLRYLLSRGSRREDQKWSLVFRGLLARKEVALGEEVGSESGGDSRGSGCIRRSCGPVFGEEEAGEDG